MIRRAAIALFVTSGVTSLSLGDIDFSDVLSEVGILPYTQPFGMTGGVAAVDFDFDCDGDMFVPTLVGIPDQLYRNLGDGTFEEIAVAAGVCGSPVVSRTISSELPPSPSPGYPASPASLASATPR